MLALTTSTSLAAVSSVSITEENIENFDDLENRYACYMNQDSAILGTYNARTLKVGATWRPLSDSIRRKVELVETPPGELTAQQRRKLRQMSRRERSQLREISFMIDDCEGESDLPTPVPTQAATATPRPTSTSTPRPGTPTPRPTSTTAPTSVPTLTPTRTATAVPTRTPTTAPTQTPRPSATPTSAPQPTSVPGSRKAASMGMGLAGVTDYSGQYPYLDLMKQSRPWNDWRSNTRLTDFDANGWPRSLPSGGTAGTVFLVAEPGTIPFDKVVVRYKGKGRITYSGSRKIDAESSAGRDVLELVPGNSFLQIEQTDPSDYIRDITIVPQEFLADYDRGEIFNPLWIERIKEFRAVRFMDWMSTNGSTQSAWANRPKLTDFSWALSGGAPIEVMVALANKINADPWFNMPHLATDDYVRRFGQYVRDNLARHLQAYFEYSNEVWNFSFEQSQHALREGKKLWGDEGTAWVQYLGMKSAQICDIMKKEVYVGQTNRVKCVMGIFTGWEDTQQYTLDCPNWAAQGNEPCYKHGIDVMAGTGYFSGCLNGSDSQSTVRGWAREGAAGITKAFEQVLDGRHFNCSDTIAGNFESYKRMAKRASDRGLQLVAYEGGQHITSNGHPTQDDPEFINFHIALNRSPQMEEIYRKNFENWKNAGGTIFMHFVDISPYTKWGSWGALEYLLQPNTAKMKAIQESNKRACWWPGC